MSLLPSRPDAEPAADAGPRVIGVDSEDADEVLSALSSGTARHLLASLHEEPATPSELADRLDTTLQNVQYHLEKLDGAGAVEVVDTAYSAKGREMDVYAPADRPLVIFAGDEERGSTLRTALSRLLGGLGILAVASLVVQSLYGRTDLFPQFGLGAGSDEAPRSGAGGDGGDGDAGGNGGDAAAPAPTEDEDVASGNGNGADGGGVDPQADSPTPEPSTTFEEATQTPTGDAVEYTPTPSATETPVPTNTSVPTEAPDLTMTPEAADAIAGSGLPPGLLFFAGGAFVLAVLVLALYLRDA